MQTDLTFSQISNEPSKRDDDSLDRLPRNHRKSEDIKSTLFSDCSLFPSFDVSSLCDATLPNPGSAVSIKVSLSPKQESFEVHTLCCLELEEIRCFLAGVTCKHFASGIREYRNDNQTHCQWHTSRMIDYDRMIHSRGASHYREETTIYQSVEDADIKHASESNLSQGIQSTITPSNQFTPDEISFRSDSLETHYASPYSSIPESPASIGSPIYECGISCISQDYLSPFDAFISRSDSPAGETICLEPSQGCHSPHVQEIDEFLDLSETSDMSTSCISTEGVPGLCVGDASCTLASYVPVQARPLISYTEHQRAIYPEYSQYPHERIGFDMTETAGTANADTSCDNCVCHDLIDADELYDMSLEALNESNYFHFP